MMTTGSRYAAGGRITRRDPAVAALAALLVAPAAWSFGLVHPARSAIVVARPFVAQPSTGPAPSPVRPAPGFHTPLPGVPQGPEVAPINITTVGVTLTGAHFTPITITTGTVTLTGAHFTPVTLTTGPITLTGTRFTPVTVTTGTVTLAGAHFTPVILTTATVTLTGPHPPAVPRRLPRFNLNR